MCPSGLHLCGFFFCGFREALSSASLGAQHHVSYRSYLSRVLILTQTYQT